MNTEKHTCRNCWSCAGTPRESKGFVHVRTCRETGLRVFTSGLQLVCCAEWRRWPSRELIARKANQDAAERINTITEERP